jgi:hypothetical protein
MGLKVKYYEVRYGALVKWCVNKFICVERPKLVKVFKRNEYAKALDFASKVNGKVETNYTL